MAKITIPRTEYQALKKQAMAFRFFAERFFESLLNDPVSQVVDDFRKTDLYTAEFLADLEDGLLSSSWHKQYGNTANKRKIKAKNY
ncbi:hypothetical protein FJ208_01435 [Candidatus Gribaldobacteria bacterium]|nr:hypothetical protein [Candidatus Gribaldobacteria bacterium]